MSFEFTVLSDDRFIEILQAWGACLIVCVSVFCLKGLMHDE